MKSIYWETSDDEVASILGGGSEGHDGYPVQDDIRVGEPGQGYVLRMARANFLTGLADIRRRLGKHSFTTLSSSDAPFIARWLGADLSKLKVVLEESKPIVSGGVVETSMSRYAGHFIPLQNYLNRIAPRVCPECLAENDYCRVKWDFSFVTACPKHERLLMDRCPGCMKAISWQRPGIDICQCGTYLSDLDLCLQDRASELDLDVSRLMSQWIDGLPTQKSNAASDLPLLELIRPLSLQGGMNIIRVLSVAEESKEFKNSSIEDGQMLERCRKTLLKANEFSKKLATNDLEIFRSKKRPTLIPILAQCMHESYTYEDRSLAQSLISTILRANGKLAKTVGGIPVQQSLFSG